MCHYKSHVELNPTYKLEIRCHIPSHTHTHKQLFQTFFKSAFYNTVFQDIEDPNTIFTDKHKTIFMFDCGVLSFYPCILVLQRKHMTSRGNWIKSAWKVNRLLKSLKLGGLSQKSISVFLLKTHNFSWALSTTNQVLNQGFQGGIYWLGSLEGFSLFCPIGEHTWWGSAALNNQHYNVVGFRSCFTS